MKLLYIGTHSVLERDELSLFTELGIDCFSYQGAYMIPEGHPSLIRPGIPGMTFHKELAEQAVWAKTKIPQEFFDLFDAIMIMHDPNVVVENWDRMKHKPVIWRTIGQSIPTVENMVRKMRYEGMKIVRMSQKEENIIGFVGNDSLIRFYKDPEEFKDWNGQTKRVINLTQSLKGRRAGCHYDAIMQIIDGFPSLIYGVGNTDLGSLDGGEMTYDLMKGALRDNRVFVYAGTWPSPYTLSLMEAMMTGIPVVAIGSELANAIVPQNERWDYYDIPTIIKNGSNGFYSDNINELRGYISQLFEDEELAKRISQEGRKTAIRLWGKDHIKKNWEEFFAKL